MAIDLFLKLDGIPGDRKTSSTRARSSWSPSVGARRTARKAGKDQQDYLFFKFKDVLIASYQVGGAEAGDLPMQQVSFNFARIDFEYRSQKPDGTLAPAVKAGGTSRRVRRSSLRILHEASCTRAPSCLT